MRSMGFIQHIENRGRILKLQFSLTATKKPQTFCLQKAKSVEEVGERKGKEVIIVVHMNEDGGVFYSDGRKWWERRGQV